MLVGIIDQRIHAVQRAIRGYGQPKTRRVRLEGFAIELGRRYTDDRERDAAQVNRGADGGRVAREFIIPVTKADNRYGRCARRVV